MPRQVDHEGRRRQIAQGVFELIAERGLEAATLRDVAARAGVSMGAAQRCFRTKQDMLLYALEHMNEQVTARIQAQIADSDEPGATLTILEQTLLGTFPTDEQGRAEARVWLAFSAQAAVDPKLAAVQREQYEGLAELITLLIRVAQDAGQLAHDLDAGSEAEFLITYADGLNMQLLLSRQTPTTARAALHRRLTALRTP
ncbi:TetR/AcrR family transcriptional regulator [Streptomyces xanthochromogenes]|uniref:TetR/AcrR family transcriptional regulator n=1 Tax=Streptomyces xanthochromogenes TaxID=67384 RepID=UPI00379EB88B